MSDTVFKNEPYFVAALLFFVVFYFWGKRANERRVNKWCVHPSR